MDAGPDMEPDLSGFLLELDVGVHGIGILFSGVFRPGRQVPVLLVGGPVGAGAGIRIGVLVIDAYRRFHVLDAGCIGVHAQLRGGDEAR